MRHPTGKEEVKLSLLADNMMSYIEYAIGSAKKLLDPINEFGKVAGYKINTQKYVSILYTSTELSERETKKTITFTIATTKNTVSRNKLNQGGKRPVLRKL